MRFSDERAYIGDVQQLLTLQESKLCGGRQEGVRIVQVHNGADLQISVLPDRCMDFYQIRYKGKNLNYITPAGIVSPVYYDERGLEWLRSFAAGFLTTCGLQNIGGPDLYEGKEHGLHGRIANTPAEGFSARYENQDGVPAAVLQGTMREAVLFGENFTLERKITVPYGKNEIVFSDTVTNRGFRRNHYMLLYHFNYGYPLLSEDTQLTLETEDVAPRNAHAAAHAESWQKVLPPQDDFEEMCYFHKVKKDEKGRARYSLYNPRENIGVELEYDGELLDNFCQWKMFGKGEYVMGLEPANTLLDGFDLAKEKGLLHYLEAGESVTLDFVIRFFEK